MGGFQLTAAGAERATAGAETRARPLKAAAIACAFCHRFERTSSIACNTTASISGLTRGARWRIGTN